MEEEQGPAKWEIAIEKLLRLAGLGVILWSFLFIDFTGRGRLWDRISGQQIAPNDMARLSEPNKTVLTKASASDRFLVSQPDKAGAAEQTPSFPTAAELAAQVPPFEPRREDKAQAPHLNSTLADLHDSRRAPTEQTSASMGLSGIQSAPSVTDTRPTPTYSIEQPAPLEKQPAVASRNSRGARRSDTTRSSAGPVYNLNGAGRGQAPPRIGESAQ